MYETTEIAKLMDRGWTDDQIFVLIGNTHCPEVFEDDEERRHAANCSGRAAQLEGGGIPAYDQEAAHLLRADIRRLRREHQPNSMAVDDQVVALSAVQEAVTNRLPTLIPSLDEMLGSTKRYNDQFEVIGETFGLPLGKLGLLGGEEGAGKTRFYTALAIRLIMMHMHLPHEQRVPVVVFQGEMSPEEYKELAMSMCRASGVQLSDEAQCYLLCSKSRSHTYQTTLVKNGCPVRLPSGQEVLMKPRLAIVDSFPMIMGSRSAAGIEDIVFQWKKALGQYCSGLMLAHLNKEGKIKGNNLISYLVDNVYTMRIEQDLNAQHGDGFISITSGKARSGKRNAKVYCRHVRGTMRFLPGRPGGEIE